MKTSFQKGYDFGFAGGYPEKRKISELSEDEFNYRKGIGEGRTARLYEEYKQEREHSLIDICENCNKRFAEGFKAGQSSILRQNKSGCCCIIDDNSNVISACGAHENWRDQYINENVIGLLTVNDLEQMDCEATIAKGQGIFPEIHIDRELKWIAIKHDSDWAIYIHFACNDYEYVAEWGEKLLDEGLIRGLVFCTDKAWGMYRF